MEFGELRVCTRRSPIPSLAGRADLHGLAISLVEQVGECDEDSPGCLTSGTSAGAGNS